MCTIGLPEWNRAIALTVGSKPCLQIFNYGKLIVANTLAYYSPGLLSAGKSLKVHSKVF